MGKPKIRFEGYSEDWEQRKLGELGTVQTCKRIFKEQTSEQGDIPFFKNGTIGLEPDSYISREVYEEFRRLYPYPEVGDTLISVVGSIGRTAEYTGKDEYFQDSNVVWLKTDGSINKKFLKVSYQVIKWLIEGSTVKHLYNDNILRSEIIMPSSQIEQAKIAEFFEALDHLITLHQRKCDETKTLKKYMLQKMFPQNGEKVPEIRFDGFTEDWEQRKLGEIITEYKETVDSDCTLPILTSSKTEGVILQEEHFGRKQQHDITGYNILPRNYCTYRNRSDGVDFTFNINKCCDKGIISKFYPVFSGKNSDVFFLSLVLNNSDEVVREIAYTCTGTGQKVLSFLDLQKMKVRVPSYDEQKEIAAYFENLDHLITLHQRKCNELKEIKKYMLQNMFV